MVEGRLQHGQTDAVTEEAVVRDKSCCNVYLYCPTLSDGLLSYTVVLQRREVS